MSVKLLFISLGKRTKPRNKVQGKTEHEEEMQGKDSYPGKAGLACSTPHLPQAAENLDQMRG
jgi:hypothetical protein